MRTRILALFTLVLTVVTLALSASPAFAAIKYGSGEYTNLCGSGYAANSHSCSGQCNTTNGTCSSAGSYVVKFVCDGRQTECRSNESSFSSYQSLSGVGCGKTVQLDVFNKACRVNGGWNCGDGDLKDYMVWYSGDCAALPTPTPQPTTAPTPTPTPTPTPVAHTSFCNALEVTTGNSQVVPAKVTLRARAQDNKGNIERYRFFFGDGQQAESTTAELTHTYEVSGNFVARVEAKDSQGKWITSRSCETGVYVKPQSVESHKSGCSNVFILEGNNQQAPSTVKLKITGYDNKGSLKKFKMDFGNGVVKEADGQEFEQRYDRPGTYAVKAYVLNSKDEWKGGESSCTSTVYINTKPLTQQPKTGTPTSLTVAAIASGIVGAVMLLQYKARQQRS